MIQRAYNIQLLDIPPDRKSPENHGWCYGLPPGISTEQWPIDPMSGYPLMHGFTVLLPEDYRVHGPEFVALSFFSTAMDQNGGGAYAVPELHDSVLGLKEPKDQVLLSLYHREKNKHPQLFRMTDILGYHYAIILLTRAEFDGALAKPPQVQKLPLKNTPPEPEWLTDGAAYAYTKDYWEYRRKKPNIANSIETSFGIKWSPRQQDPNAGKTPDEYPAEDAVGAYQTRFYWLNDEIKTENYRLHEWTKDHAENHIGGTMNQIQGIPQEFSPYYIGFEEYFGGYNFGDGNAQLDFKNMKFDWACG